MSVAPLEIVNGAANLQARTHMNDQPNVAEFDHLLLLRMLETVCQRRTEKIVRYAFIRYS